MPTYKPKLNRGVETRVRILYRKGLYKPALLIVFLMLFPNQITAEPNEQLHSQNQLNSAPSLCDERRAGSSVFRLNKDILCFFGPISESSFSTFSQNTDARVLVIQSSGGPVELGLKMGHLIKKKKMDVLVNKFCLSSCANYLFLSGVKKIYPANSLVGFHGGPARNLESAIRVLYKSPEKFAALQIRATHQKLKEEKIDQIYDFLDASLPLVEQQAKLLSKNPKAIELIYDSQGPFDKQEIELLAAKVRLPPNVIAMVPAPNRMTNEYKIEGIFCGVCEFGNEYVAKIGLLLGFDGLFMESPSSGPE